MNYPLKNFSKDIMIINELGLHARAAAKIAEIAAEAKSGVWILKDDKKADAKSIIDILTLGCVKGAEITVQIEDYTSDAHILNRIESLVQNGFGE
jgi:phosphocarrier protein